MRYPTIDALRGFALISMVSSHVSLPDDPTQADIILHKAVWIDGAFYFVALSGLVAGLVHRRIVDRYGFDASARKLTKRAGFIYLVQLFLVALTITLASVRSSAQLFNTPTWGELGGVLRGMVDVALLRVEPNFTGVLPMYVFFLLLAVPAVWALRKGLWWAVVGGSLALFVVAKGLGGFRFASWGGSFDPFGWQLLFIGGLLLGWGWEHERLAIPERLRRWAVMASIAATAVFLFLALRMAERTEDVFGPLLSKFGGPPLAFVFAGCALITAYAILDRARALAGREHAAPAGGDPGCEGSPRLRGDGPDDPLLRHVPVPAPQRPDGHLRGAGGRVLGVRGVEAGSAPVDPHGGPAPATGASGQRRIRLKRCPCSSSVVTRNFCGIL